MFSRFFKLSILTAFMIVGSANANSEIHIVHCLYGCPVGTPTTNDLVVREIYALSSNDSRKFADWVAYRVTRSTIGTSKDLKRTWKKDPLLEEDETLEKKDYDGASKPLEIDRGHQAPLASFANTVYWRDTNYLSNITPQKKGLNRGPWKELEKAVRDLAYKEGEVYVLTGPLYEEQSPMVLPRADEQHTVPSGYWKVVATKAGKLSGFIFNQNTLRNDKYCKEEFEVSVLEIEKRSGLDLLPHAPEDWGNKSLRMQLGCRQDDG